MASKDINIDVISKILIDVGMINTPTELLH